MPGSPAGSALTLRTRYEAQVETRTGHRDGKSQGVASPVPDNLEEELQGEQNEAGVAGTAQLARDIRKDLSCSAGKEGGSVP